MIQELNRKYGAGSRLFLEILETFRTDPTLLFQQPHPKVKQLIQSTLDKLSLALSQPTSSFRNQNLGNMFAMLSIWFSEIKGTRKHDEITKKELVGLLIKKKILVDEKELEGLFKDCGGEGMSDKVRIKRDEFMGLFMRPCFKGAL